MKKIVALLLSMLMILGMAAVAEEATEPALISHIGNIVIENTADGQTQTLGLDGFEAYFALDTSDGLALIAQAFNGEEFLAQAMGKLVGTQFQLGIDGVDKTFAADVPQLAGQDTAGLGEALRPMLPGMLNMTLPPIQIPSLPKVDLVPVVGMLGATPDGDTTAFEVPSEVIDTLLDQVLEAVKTSGESISGVDQVLPAIEQLRASGMSFALKGQIVDAADKQTTTLEIYIVNGGQTSEAPLAVLTLTSVPDELTLAVDIAAEGENMTIANLTLDTDSATNSFAGTLDIGDMMQFQLAIFQENGLQNAALTVDSPMGAAFGVTLSYGKSGDADVCDLTFAAGEDVGFEMHVSTTQVDETASEGTFEISVVTEDNSIHVTADVEEFLGEMDLGGFALSQNVVPFDDFSSEETGEALQTALAPLLQYFNQIAANVAA